MKTKVIAAFREFAKTPDAQNQLDRFAAGDDIELADIGLTSLQMVEISMQLEESCGIEVDLEEFESADTLAGFVAFCEKAQTV